MIKKVIVLVFVSFFVMSGLIVLNENNQNYNISNNNVKLDTLSTNNIISENPIKIYHIQYMPKRVINGAYTHALFSQLFISYNGNIYYANGSNIVNQYNKTLLSFPSTYVFTALSIYQSNLYIAFTNGEVYVYNFTLSNDYYVNSYSSASIYFGNNSLFVFYNGILTYYSIIYSSVDNAYVVKDISNIILFTNNPKFNWDSSSNGNYINMLIEGNAGDAQTYFYMIQKNPFELYYSDTYGNVIQAENNSYSANNFTFFDKSSYGFFNNNLFSTINWNLQYSSMSTSMQYSNNYLIPFTINQSSLGSNTSNFFPTSLIGYKYNTFFSKVGNEVNPTLYYLNISEDITSNSKLDVIFGNNFTYIISYSQKEIFVFSFKEYLLNVKSYNILNNQIQNYFSFNGIIYTGYSNSFVLDTFPQILLPLNTSTYYYNGSAITIIQSDFSGSGSNLYYNLSIYYQEIKPASIPLYDIFTYMYPISIIGLFVGMGSFIFVIKKRGYKI